MSEEFYGIAIRKKSDNQDLFWLNNDFLFEEVKFNISSRYWIADPFLVEEKGVLYVFYEMFDYFRGKGVIAYSIIDNYVASKPVIVIEENYHLSFPFIWNDNGKYFIMPESSEAKNLTVYEAIDFPSKWVRKKELISGITVCDSVILNTDYSRFILSSKMNMDEPYFYCNVTNCLFRYNKDESVENVKTLATGDYGVRNAGSIVIHKNGIFRPGQISTNGVYGKGLAIWRLNSHFMDEECVFEGLYDELINHLLLKEIDKELVEGVHTYNSSDNFEVIDIKYKKELNKKELLRNKIGALPYKIRFHLKKLTKKL